MSNRSKRYTDEFKKQIVWLVISLVMMVAVMIISYETLVKISDRKSVV